MALLGSAGVLSAAAASPAAAAACTDKWTGPTSGAANWNTSADWSARVPKGSSVACIEKAGTYTVSATTPGDAAAAV